MMHVQPVSLAVHQALVLVAQYALVLWQQGLDELHEPFRVSWQVA